MASGDVRKDNGAGAVRHGFRSLPLGMIGGLSIAYQPGEIAQTGWEWQDR
ncbi:hypothetical protein [Robbsia sp. KACC 23696]